MSELEREQGLGYPIPSGGSSESFNKTLQRRGFGSWKMISLNSFHAQVKLLEGGFGIALLRRECIRAQLESGDLVEIQAPFPVATPVFLSWRSKGYLDEASNYLRQQLMSHGDALG